MTVGSSHEVPVFVPFGEETLFGIWTSPPEKPRRTGVVLLAGGAFTPSTSRNRLWVRMARQLADLGFHVFRFDYHGVGESTGLCEGYRFDRPFTKDLAAVSDWLNTREEIDSVVFVGACFGARTALSFVAEREDLAALVLFAPPVHEFEMGTELGVGGYLKKAWDVESIKGLFDKRRRFTYKRIIKTKARVVMNRLRRRVVSRTSGADSFVSPMFYEFMSRVVEREIPTLVVFGDEDEFLQQWEKASLGALGRLVSQAKGTIEVKTIPGGEVHAFTKTVIQDAVTDLLVTWLSEADGTRNSPTRRASQTVASG